MRLYHRTTRDSGNEILRTGVWNSKDSKGYVWFSDRPTGHAAGYGDTTLLVDVPSKYAELSDEFPDGEKHWMVPKNRLKGLAVQMCPAWLLESHPNILDNPAYIRNPEDFLARLEKKKVKEKAERRAKIESVLDESISILASDPGMQSAARKRRAERDFAERVAGPEVFAKGDKVIWAGEEDAIPATWVGTIVEHQWFNEDRPIYDAEGRYTGQVEERPYHSYVVRWQEPNGTRHEGFYAQDELAAKTVRRKNPTTEDDKAAIVQRFNTLIDTANRRAAHAADGALVRAPRFRGHPTTLEPFWSRVSLIIDEHTALNGRPAHGRGFAASTEDTVYVTPALVEAGRTRAGRDRQVGVLAHELAHVSLLQRGDVGHTEREADTEAEALFGHTIRYDADDVQTIGPGVAPRPAYLDRRPKP